MPDSPVAELRAGFFQLLIDGLFGCGDSIRILELLIPITLFYPGQIMLHQLFLALAFGNFLGKILLLFLRQQGLSPAMLRSKSSRQNYLCQNFADETQIFVQFF